MKANKKHPQRLTWLLRCGWAFKTNSRNLFKNINHMDELNNMYERLNEAFSKQKDYTQGEIKQIINDCFIDQIKEIADKTHRKGLTFLEKIHSNILKA